MVGIKFSVKCLLPSYSDHGSERLIFCFFCFFHLLIKDTDGKQALVKITQGTFRIACTHLHILHMPLHLFIQGDMGKNLTLS